MTPQAEIFDRKLLSLKRQRASNKFSDHDFLFNFTHKQIQDRLADIQREFKTILEVGSRGQAIFEDSINLDIYSHPKTHIMGDEEFLPFKDKSLDLILTNLGLHSTNDLPGTLVQMRRALKPDGLFLGAMFGGETLFELRESLMQTEMEMFDGVSPRVFPFADKQQMGALLQRAGYALPVVDSEILTVTYPHIFKLMADLRGMGETNIISQRSKKYPGRDFFTRAAEYYAQNFADEDGRIRATFEIIFLIGWSPHVSQQQPLKPGSAKTRLADALATDEIKTGEKASP